MTERDTKFKSFARLLWTEIVQSPYSNIHILPEEADTLERIIAQRAYDLACHVLAKDWDNTSAALHDISDLTQWPPTE